MDAVTFWKGAESLDGDLEAKFQRTDKSVRCAVVEGMCLAGLVLEEAGSDKQKSFLSAAVTTATKLGVYKDMEVTEYLDFFAACYRIGAAKREQTINDVLELVGLSEKKGALIGALSRGMQQRIGLATVK